MRNVSLVLVQFCASVFLALNSLQTSADLINVGALPDDGTSVGFTGDLADSELDFYSFTLPGDVADGDGSFLNIQTFGQPGFALVDTQIALYDALGMLIAVDDDDNGDDTFTILYSLLTFGDGDPLGDTVDSTAGQDGTVSAGDFTLVVGGFFTEFSQDIDDIIGGTSRGQYNVQFTHGAPSSVVPAPSMLPLFGFALVGLAFFGRRSRR